MYKRQVGKFALPRELWPQFGESFYGAQQPAEIVGLDGHDKWCKNAEQNERSMREQSAARAGCWLVWCWHSRASDANKFCHDARSVLMRAKSVVIPSEARDLGFCLRHQYRCRAQKPRSLASLGMTILKRCV